VSFAYLVLPEDGCKLQLKHIHTVSYIFGSMQLVGK